LSKNSISTPRFPEYSQKKTLEIFFYSQNNLLADLRYICKNIDMNPNILHKIRDTLEKSPVSKAWLFGSFARNEETKDSDIDILVQFNPNAKISLFDYGGIVYNLEQSTGRRIDLVEEHTLKPFAKATAERDKKLIYERKTS
jgi:predicted nucleotidyltransferase